MGRLTLELPAGLGTDRSDAESGRARERRTDLDNATATFVRWVDCWAGRARD